MQLGGDRFSWRQCNLRDASETRRRHIEWRWRGARVPRSRHLHSSPDSFLFSPRSGENYRSSGCESLRQALQFTIVMPGLVPSIDVLRGVAGKPWLAEVSPGSVGLLSVFLGVA